jgi:EAL domain-containing protein (putative c-di-GMP-specific phosphodiesterase class I)
LTQEEHITAIAKKVLAVLSSPIRLGGQELFTTASIGISIFPLDGEDPPTLLKNADMAMYQAKEQGRNTLQFFSREMNARAEERLKLENSLRRALERNELFLHYQPQVNLQTGAAVGMEALLRWQHPELGLLSPLKFIPIAEENGLIVPIGEWVLRTACAQTKAWQEAGFGPLRVAVNLSGRQFKQPDFVERVGEILKQTGLAPSCLELELTESTIMSNGEETIRILQKLKNMGVTLAIDDFGTGYSSLSYLKHFPIDRLKIDRSFVLDIPHDPDNAAIAEAIIVLAHSLKLQVTAEGVEQSDQLEFLATRHCDELQGYYVSRPVAAQDFAALLVEGISLRRPAPALASMPARSCRTRTARA